MDGRVIATLLFVCIYTGSGLVSCNNNLATALVNKIESEENIIPVPGGEGAISANARAAAISVSWTPATDNLIPHERLEYRVVCSASGNIKTLEEALKNLDEEKSSGWLEGVIRGDATGLSDVTKYYLNVLVRDRSGNMAAYNMIDATTVLDEDPPGLPNGNLISTGVIEEESFTISWPVALDEMTPVNLLQYNVYYSDTDAVDTLQAIESGSNSSTGWQTSTYATITDGVTDNTTYNVNVVVRDERLNKRVYLARTVMTERYPRLYWVENENNRIRSAHLDGSNSQVIIETGAAPYAIAVDSANRIVYWSEHGIDKISCADMDDGTFIKDLIIDNTGDVYGLAYDSRNNTIYWSDDRKIYNAPVTTINGDSVNFKIDNLCTDIEARSNILFGITLDLVNNKIFWVESDEIDGSDSRICRADITSDNPPVVINPDTFYNSNMMLPRAISIDTNNDFVFWSDDHTQEPFPIINRINTNNTNYIPAITLNITSVHGIASYFDASIPASYFYWTDMGTDNIYRAPVTVSSGDAADFPIITGAGNPEGIALDL